MFILPYLPNSPNRAFIFKAGSTGTLARSIPSGINIAGVVRIAFPANSGSHSRWASS